MSKTISFKGKINMGEQDRIKLSTNTGKVGYKITKFQLMSTTPGKNAAEYVGQIFSKDQTGSISSTVDFTNADLSNTTLFNASFYYSIFANTNFSDSNMKGVTFFKSNLICFLNLTTSPIITTIIGTLSDIIS